MTLLELIIFTISIITISVSLTLYFIDINKRIKMRLCLKLHQTF